MGRSHELCDAFLRIVYWHLCPDTLLDTNTLKLCAFLLCFFIPKGRHWCLLMWNHLSSQSQGCMWVQRQAQCSLCSVSCFLCSSSLKSFFQTFWWDTGGCRGVFWDGIEESDLRKCARRSWGQKQQTSSTKNLCACLVCENLSLMA